MTVGSKYRVIDTDTHLIEPPNLWTDRLPKAWGDDVLHVRWDEKAQAELWFFGDEPLKAAWQWANWGWEGKGEVHDGSGPTRQSEAHPATYDPKARVAFMDEQGFEMQVLYPNLAGFDWKPFVQHKNPEVAMAHLRAYNDFQLEWVQEFPGRFIPMMVVPYWDVKQTVAEIERLADAGFGGIVTTGAPHEHGQAPLGSRSWDPMWRACEEAGLSVSFHTASGDFRQLMERHEDDEVSGGALVVRDGPHMYLANANHVADLLMSGIMARFPTLQFASVESGIGWAPFVLEALDKRFEKNGVALSHAEFGGLLPSDFFKRQMSVNFWFEELDDYHLRKLDLRCLLFETDFPHPTGYHRPSLDENIELVMANMPDEVRRQILWDNPAKLYAKALEKQGVRLDSPVPV